MTWWAWLILGAYIAVALLVARKVAGEVAWSYNHYPDADNICGGLFCGVIAGAAWPVFLPICMCCVPTMRYFMVEKVFYSPHDRSRTLELRR